MLFLLLPDIDLDALKVRHIVNGFHPAVKGCPVRQLVANCRTSYFREKRRVLRELNRVSKPPKSMIHF
jgi:hypothetical protein